MSVHITSYPNCQSSPGLSEVHFGAADEVYAAESYECRYDEDGQEIESFDSFVVMHIVHARGRAGTYHSVGTFRGFETPEEAQAAAVRIARENNAVLS
jgi:hypothetical protein